MVYVLLGTGFEEIEAITPVDLLRRAGIEVQTVGISGKVVCGSHGIGITADITAEQMQPSQTEMIVLPGGLGGVASLKSSAAAMQAVRDAWENGNRVAAICAAPTILAELGITDGKCVTCYPGCEAEMGGARLIDGRAVVCDGKLITGTSAGCAASFALALIAALRGQQAAERVATQIVIR